MRVEDTQLSAVRQIQERQGTVGSFLFINPVESMKTWMSPTAVAAYGMYAHRTGSMFIGLPYMFTPSLVFRGHIARFMGKVIKQPATALGPQAMTAIAGGGGWFGGGRAIAEMLNIKDRKVFMKEFSRAIRKANLSKLDDGSILHIMNDLTDRLNTKAPHAVAKRFGGAVAATGKHATAITKMIKTSIVMKTAGAILWPYALASAVGLIAARSVDFAFKAGISAMNITRAAAEHARALEFGGTLGAGYVTQEAATERQRAIKMMQRNHISGRKSLGAEAMNYSMLI